MNGSDSYPHVPSAKALDTAFASAADMVETAPTLRGKAYKMFRAGALLTADEVASNIDMSILSIRPRVAELARMGKIIDSGLRRANASGKQAIVWKLADPRAVTIAVAQCAKRS